MKSKIKFRCPSCGRQIESTADIVNFSEAVKLDSPCQCGFSQVVLSALSSGIDSITAQENAGAKEK